MRSSVQEVTLYPTAPPQCRHPVTQALRAVAHAHAHAMEAWRVVQENLGVEADPRYAAVLLAPQRIMRRQVVVLIDWTRCGRVKSLALPVYVSALRRAQSQIRRSSEFYFLLHYPQRHLDALGFDAALHMLRDHLVSMDQDRQAILRNVLECRLLHGMGVLAIGEAMQLRTTQINAILREAAFAYRRGRVIPNPLDPFRFGAARWGGFRLDWDDLPQDYVICPEDRPSQALCNDMEQLLSEITWNAPTAHMGLRPAFDQALPSQQAQVDVWASSEDGVNLAELFAEPAW